MIHWLVEELLRITIEEYKNFAARKLGKGQLKLKNGNCSCVAMIVKLSCLD